MPSIISSFKNFVFENNWLLHVLSGLMLGLSVPGIGVWPLAWVGLVPGLIGLVRCKNFLMAFLHGTLMGVIYNIILFQWFRGLEPLTWMGFSPTAGIITMFAAWGVVVVVQSLIIGIIWTVLFASYKRFAEAGLVLLPILWVCGIWFLNQQPLGLPWGFLTYSQATLSMVRQSAYIITFWGVEQLIVFANVLIALAIIKRRWQPLVVFTASILAMVLLVLRLPPPPNVLDKLSPVVIQGNLSIEQEHQGLTFETRHAHYRRLITQAFALDDGRIRLVVLPEGAMVMGDYAFRVPPHTAVLTGGLIETPAKWYNAALLYLIDRNQVSWVTKRYLVPFGETTPFVPGKWLKKTLKSLWDVDYSLGFSAGRLAQKPLDFEGLRIGPLICFEALYPNLTWRYQRQQVGLLATFSNLGWYHQNRYLQQQFLAINQFRASETRLPLILATNTGVSAIISPTGEILSRSGSGKTQILWYKKPPIVPSSFKN